MLTRAILRALCALLVGFLLISNPTDMTVLIVQIIGGLFALSGLIAIVGYFTSRAKSSGFRPVFPVVGIGSLAFGVCLFVWPSQFVSILMYVLGGLLTIIGTWQIYNLIGNRKFAPITWSLFVLPLMIVAAGVFVIINPIEGASIPFIILGSAFIVYGVCEFLLGIRFYRYHRLFEAAEAHDAEVLEVTDVLTDSDVTDAVEI